jgi:hypothetical protein
LNTVSRDMMQRVGERLTLFKRAVAMFLSMH